MSALPVTVSISSDATALPSVMLCPFHDGAATLDALLAELEVHEAELFDATLDLRSLFATGADAGACVEQLYRIRTLLGGRHYLAFYRVRCWAVRNFRIAVRASRFAGWLTQPLPLDGARSDEVINAALAAVAEDGIIPATAHARFVFADAV